MHLCVFTVPGILGETSPISQQSHTEVTHRDGELTQYKRADRASDMKPQSLVVSTGGEAGVSLKPGSYNGSTHLVSGSPAGLSGIHGTDELKCWVVGALSSQSPRRGGGTTHICVQMESLSKCPALWFWAFQSSSKGVPIMPHYFSLDIALGIPVMADSDSMLDCQRCPKSLLCSYCMQLLL